MLMIRDMIRRGYRGVRDLTGIFRTKGGCLLQWMLALPNGFRITARMLSSLYRLCAQERVIYATERQLTRLIGTPE